MKLVELRIEKDYGNYSAEAKLVATARFSGPFGDLSVKLSEPLVVDIINRIAAEAAGAARANAGAVEEACNTAVNSLLALTHEAEAS